MENSLPCAKPEPTREVTLVCPQCEQEHPQTDCIVSRDEQGNTRTLCLPCHQKQPAKLAAQQEEARKADEMRDMLRCVGKASAPTISELCGALIDKFDNGQPGNGLPGFVTFYHKQLEAAAGSANGKGSARVLAGCAGIAKIVSLSTDHQASLPGVSQMTDKDLAREWELGLMDVLRGLSPAELTRLQKQAELATDDRHRVKSG